MIRKNHPIEHQGSYTHKLLGCVSNIKGVQTEVGRLIPGAVLQHHMDIKLSWRLPADPARIEKSALCPLSVPGSLPW